MPLLLCHVHLTVPTSTSQILSGAASVEQAALSIPICSFHVLLCAVRALEPVYVEPVYGLVVLIKVGMRSIISPTQASKALLFARATATVYAFFPLRSSFGLALGSDTSGWFSGNFIKRFLFWHPLPCHVLFQDYWGDCSFVYLDFFQDSTSKGLRRNMLFLCPLLVPFPCSFEGSQCFMILVPIYYRKLGWLTRLGS